MPGPTLLMKAGTQCKVKIVNDLPAYAPGSPSSNCPYHANAVHCCDTHTLHTHGLYVSPYQDNIDSYQNPGQTETYTYDLPVQHMMGTHWYHAHHHGSTNIQVSGGMAGALIVQPADSYPLPSDLAVLYGTSSTEKLLMLNHLWLGPGDPAGTPFGLKSHTEISAMCPDQTITPNYTGNGINVYVVNGDYQPTVQIFQNDATVFRLTNGAGNKAIELQISGGACTMKIIARDGIFQGYSYLTTESVVIVQGGRADVAVYCDAVGTYTMSITRNAINDQCLGNTTATMIQRFEQAVLMYIDVVAGGDGNPLPTSFAARPDYLQFLQNANVVATTKNGTGGAVAGVLLGGSSVPGELGVNNIAFPGFIYPFVGTSRVGTVIEIKMGRRPRTFFHPYHQHVWPFQPQVPDNCNGQVWAEFESRDVLPQQGETIRWWSSRFSGKQVVHCHILQHEDAGMMGIYNICPQDNFTGICQYPQATSSNSDSSSSSSSLSPGVIAAIAIGGALAAILILGLGYFICCRTKAESSSAGPKKADIGPSQVELQPTGGEAKKVEAGEIKAEKITHPI
eukprot:CAMPEP_0197539898 /NCGR_PEP_ID=MMETSP1318-20131121/64153_1 /TAXON_ID=552666 /ORGANISM="Partenskyella glossopodia, Strain RCC365" /LENGTH=564 /DNA_ID=CAMNT_0043098739 /DNA_START=68 /DNA_END=1762 /DNA_ORIENTATION=+